MYSFTTHDKIQVLTVDTLLDPTETQKIVEEVQELIKKGYANFIVDLQPMKYMNSTGLTFLISILTRARSAGGDVAIANLSDTIKKILLVTRLQSAFGVYDNVEEALSALTNKE